MFTELEGLGGKKVGREGEGKKLELAQGSKGKSWEQKKGKGAREKLSSKNTEASLSLGS